MIYTHMGLHVEYMIIYTYNTNLDQTNCVTYNL